MTNSQFSIPPFTSHVSHFAPRSTVTTITTSNSLTPNNTYSRIKCPPASGQTFGSILSLLSGLDIVRFRGDPDSNSSPFRQRIVCNAYWQELKDHHEHTNPQTHRPHAKSP